MPWKDVNAMELRIQFITDWLRKTHTVIDLCGLYAVSCGTRQSHLTPAAANG